MPAGMDHETLTEESLSLLILTFPSLQVYTVLGEGE